MQYKIPDLNKIKILSEDVIERWDNRGKRFSQSLQPTKDFGLDLPIKDGDSVIYHCLNGGDVFIALAARLDCDWIAGDIRASSTDHVKEKIENPELRLETIIDSIYLNEYLISNDLEKAKYKKDKAKERLNDIIIEEAAILKDRNIKYLTGDSNYLDIPAKSVDWTFSYEPLLIFEPTAIIEMLASARKGVIFAFSKGNVPSSDSLRTLKDGDFNVAYEIANIYGLNIDIFHKIETSFDKEDEEVGYAIIKSDSELPAVDREVIKYFEKHVFPEQEIYDKSNILFEIKQLSKGPFHFELDNIKKRLKYTEENILESLKRIDKIVNIEFCNCKYSLADLY